MTKQKLIGLPALRKIMYIKSIIIIVILFKVFTASLNPLSYSLFLLEFSDPQIKLTDLYCEEFAEKVGVCLCPLKCCISDVGQQCFNMKPICSFSQVNLRKVRFHRRFVYIPTKGIFHKQKVFYGVPFQKYLHHYHLNYKVPITWANNSLLHLKHWRYLWLGRLQISSEIPYSLPILSELQIP